MAENPSSQIDSRETRIPPTAPQTNPETRPKKPAPDVRLQFWVPSAIHEALVKEATSNGMTLATWTAYVLAKRPEKVVEKILTPRGTKEKLASIPALEKELAEMTARRDALKRELDALKVKFTTPRHITCPNCDVESEVDFSDELLKQSSKPKH